MYHTLCLYLQAGLEAVSAAAAAINKDKGATLEQISRTVQDIKTAIQARKAQLAPQVKELRAARQAAQVFLCLRVRPGGRGLWDAAAESRLSRSRVLQGQDGLTRFIKPLSITCPTMCVCACSSACTV